MAHRSVAPQNRRCLRVTHHGMQRTMCPTERFHVIDGPVSRHDCRPIPVGVALNHIERRPAD